MQQSDALAVAVLGPLLRVGWLAGLPVNFQTRVAKAGRWKSLRAGQTIYAAGEPPDALYGLGEGLLDLAIPTLTGEMVTLHRAEPGLWVGESAALAQSTRTISVHAATDCRLFRVPVGALRRMLRDHPEDWQYFYLLSHGNATALALLVAELMTLSPRARFARMLLRLADAGGDVRITHEELGRLAGMSRASFRRAFADVIDSGAVRTEYRCVRIIDRAVLERLVSGDPDEA